MLWESALLWQEEPTVAISQDHMVAVNEHVEGFTPKWNELTIQEPTLEMWQDLLKCLCLLGAITVVLWVFEVAFKLS